ncbi:MAG TPA: hypothetical protein VND21_01450 [Planctomycetota bacterium]|nr:hypothetical protein [Planctomycetota bacterium]
MDLRVPVVVLAASLAGAGVGALARSAAPRPATRPEHVERALRALDGYQRRGDAAALRAAAAGLADEPLLESPWREETDLVRVAASEDSAALWRFATTGPRGPARARALLLLAARAPEPSARDRALARLRADYPSSWAARGTGGSR